MSPAASSSLRRLAAIFSGNVDWADPAIRSGTADRSLAKEPAALAAMRMNCCSPVRFSGSRQNGGQFRGQSAESLQMAKKRTNFGESVAFRDGSAYLVSSVCLPLRASPCKPRKRPASRPLCSRSTSPSRRRSGHPAGVPRHLLPQRGGERRRQPPSHLCHRLLGAAAPLQLLLLVPQRLPREHGRYVTAHLHRLPMRSPGMSCSSPRRSRSSRRMGSWSPLGKGRACHG